MKINEIEILMAKFLVLAHLNKAGNKWKDLLSLCFFSPLLKKYII